VQSAAQHNVLLISPLVEASNVAASLESLLGCSVMVAASHRAALIALRHSEYAVVVVDDCMAEGNAVAAEQLWQSLGMAVPVQVNFAFSGASRLAREVQAAIGRREHQQVVAMRAAVSQLENDLKTTVTGLLLQSQLALAEPQLTEKLTGKLELVAELAGSLRRRLERTQA
jgi:DNA-binding NtrC family response regulator